MKRFISLLLLAVTVLTVASCASAPASGKVTDDTQIKEINVTDFAGNKYTLTAPPNGICCLSVVAAEILSELGLSRSIKAASDTITATEYVPMDVQQITLDGDLATYLNLLNVDFVIYENELSDATLAVLSSGNIKSFKVASNGGINTAYSNIRVISSLMFKPDSGERIIEDMRDKISLVETLASNIPQKSTFYAEKGSPDDVYALGNDTLISELISICSGENVFSDLQGQFKVTDKQVTEKNPEVMISFVSGEKFGVSSIRARAGYDSTEAGKMGRIFVFDDTIPIRPTPSLTVALFEISYLMDIMPRPSAEASDTTTTEKE